MREMTGTEILSRRASDFTYHYANPKLVKSRSNLELTAHGRSEHRSEKNHEKHSNTGHKPTEKTATGSQTSSRKNSRVGQRSGSDAISKMRSRTKDVAGNAENPESRNGATSSLLPPISGHQISNPNLKNGGLSPRHADCSVPTRMAIRNSSPENVTGKSHENHQLNSGPDRTSHTPPITAPNIGRSGSTNNITSFGRAAQMASPDSSRVADTSRLSPINNHDRPKVKFEKKVSKLLVEDAGQHSPRAHKMSAEFGGNQQQAPQSRDRECKQRRPSIKSLPKIAPAEEPFSVRRKIEQFRKWHEEHYADALKSSQAEEESAKEEKDGNGEKAGIKPVDQVDFAKILDNNIIQNKASIPDEERAEEAAGNVSKADVNGNVVNKSKNVSTKNNKGFKSKLRPMSGATWKTWRDVNQSDAYNDVQKYIKENDLMDDEREKWIRLWISDVRMAMEESEGMFVDE